MFSYIKKRWFNNRKDFFSFEGSLLLSNAISFTNPDSLDMKYLIDMIKLLSMNKSKFVIEKPLKNKKYYISNTFTDVVQMIKRELDSNYDAYSKEFDNENDISFCYFVGSNIFFEQSVEVVQKIYHKTNSDLGDIFYSMTIKFNDGKYYFWGW